MGITAILLAAGHSRRFGTTDKLLHTLEDGRSMAVVAAQNLLSAVTDVVAVTRLGNLELQDALRALGVTVITCTESEVEMADTLAAGAKFCAMRQSTGGEQASKKVHDPQHNGYLIALADMPYIRSDTIGSIVEALTAGAAIVVPTYSNGHGVQAQRGHPVGFAGRFSEELQALQGDIGAKPLLQKHADLITLLPCDDPGILLDIDTLDDIQTAV